MISPLITQLTYEGLIDECFEIKNTRIKLPSDKFENQSQESSDNSGLKSTKTFVLNSDEEIFADLRDKNFNAVGPTLSKKAKAISAQFDERHGARTVRDLKIFVDKMPQMQVITKHSYYPNPGPLIKSLLDGLFQLNVVYFLRQFGSLWLLIHQLLSLLKSKQTVHSF